MIRAAADLVGRAGQHTKAQRSQRLRRGRREEVVALVPSASGERRRVAVARRRLCLTGISPGTSAGGPAAAAGAAAGAGLASIAEQHLPRQFSDRDGHRSNRIIAPGDLMETVEGFHIGSVWMATRLAPPREMG